jgi:hypothetical protein
MTLKAKNHVVKVKRRHFVFADAWQESADQ